MNRDEFIAKNPIETALIRRGLKLIGEGNERKALCPFHQDKTPSFSVNVAKRVWMCYAGCGGGSVIDLISKLDGISIADVLLGNGVIKEQPKQIAQNSTGELKFETVCTYDYHNAIGSLAYQVVRQHAACKDKPSGYVKTFRQRQPGANGAWIWTMDGVERVLYRLPEVMQAKTIHLCEGEKDVETLAAMGLCASCNVGGAGKWLEGYTETLAKKNVIIYGDNDEPGKKHVKQVFDSIAGKAKSVKIVKIPDAFKDVTEYAESFKDSTIAKAALVDLANSAAPHIRGVSLPIYRVSELEPIYQRHIDRMKEHSFALSRWLPRLSNLRTLVPGEFVLFLGSTGIGKTATLSNLALKTFPIPTLFFELELPAELMFERLVALKTGHSCADVELGYQSGDAFGELAIDQKLSHLHICTESRLSVKDLEVLIIKSELKIGQRPKIILIDYVGLIDAVGQSRYDRVSKVAESLKIMAKSTQTVVIAASQIARSNDENPEVGLNDGKDSGSLENSSGLVIGLWRDDDNHNGAPTIMLKVLKATKGGAGTTVTCDYNLNSLAITQRERFADIPAKSIPPAKEAR